MGSLKLSEISYDDSFAARAESPLVRLIEKLAAAPDYETEEQILYEITSKYASTAGPPLLSLAMRTTSNTTKLMAFRGLGEVKYRPAVPFLIESLNAKSPYVACNAAVALGEIGKGQTIAADDAQWNLAKKELIKLIGHGHDSGILEQASLALSRLKAHEAVPVLKRKMNHKSNQTRGWILQAIGSLGTEKDLPFVAEYLDGELCPGNGLDAVGAMETITGKDLGYPKRSGPCSPSLDRAKAWWKQNKHKYQSD
jgi:HEAT repeat protein